MFPLLSRTVQITVFVPTGKVAGASFVTVVAPQLSAVVGSPKFTFVATHKPAAAFTVTLLGHVTVGGWLSVTITSCAHVAVLPLLSRTVQITVLVPTGKLAGALFVTVVEPQLSLVTGTPKFTFVATHRPAAALTVTLLGHTSAGGWLSVTITACAHVAVFPLPSRTVHTTTFVPTGNVAGALFVTLTGPQLSLVTGVPRFTFVATHKPAAAVTVTFVGHVSVGGWASVTITSCAHVAVFPLPSRTVQITVLVPTGKLAGALFVTVTTPQLSAVTGTPKFTFVATHRPAAALTVTLLGHAIVGGCASVTITSCAHVAVFPLPSRTVHTTKFVPTGKLAGALFVTVVGPQLSAVTGTPKFTLVATHKPAAALTVTLLGQVSVGGCASVTVTVKMQVLALPLASTAVFVTVVTPTGKVLPFVRLLVTFVTLQLSVAVTVKVTLLRLHWPGSAVNTRFVGQAMAGPVVSRTITLWTQLFVFPLVSVTVQVTRLVPTGKPTGAPPATHCTR